MERKYDVITFILNIFVLRRLRVANLAESSKLKPCLLKEPLKSQTKIKKIKY